jgi:hypothetical protein
MPDGQADPVARFFANALVAIGWLVLTLGGLCTVIFGTLALSSDHEFRVRLEDWTLPGSMLAFGGGCLLVGRAIRRGLTKAPAREPSNIDD